jgi:hypothetical protein
MGNTGNSGKSVHNDRDRRHQGTSEQRIRLVIPRPPLGRESSKTPEFSAEWMVTRKTGCPEIKWGSTMWLPLGNKAAVDRLDAPIFPACGSNMVAGGVSEAEESSEWLEHLVAC